MTEYEFLKTIGANTGMGDLPAPNMSDYYNDDPDDDLSWITGIKVDSKNANTALKDSQVEGMINTITKSTADVADKVFAFQNLKSQTENSIQAYKLALSNNTTNLSIAEINLQIKQLELQMTIIDNETKRLKSTNHTTMTKYVIGGLAIVSVVGIIGYVMLKK